MSTSTATKLLPSWADQMQALERVGDDLIATWRPDGATEAERQDMNRAGALDPRRAATCAASTPTRAARCSCRCGTIAFNQGGPDPDYVYTTTEIDPQRRLPDLRIPGHVALRRDHAAEPST